MPKSITLPKNWHHCLPDPAAYYTHVVEKLSAPNASGNATAICPFHDDGHASLSIQLLGSRGLFKCFACGAQGDMITFEMRRSGAPFADAVRALMSMRV